MIDKLKKLRNDAGDWHTRTGVSCHFKGIFLKTPLCIIPEIMVCLGEPKLMQITLKEAILRYISIIFITT